MYLHIGNDVVIRTCDIIGIFDIDNTTVSRLGKGFLHAAQDNGEVVYATEDMPKSFIVTNGRGKTTVFISSMSTQVLNRRNIENKFE